jgi:predicted nucleotidyltransferase
MGRKATSRSGARSAAHRVAARPHASTLASALFSATQQRVLGLLFGQPERSFFATELIGLAGSGSGAVQRELQRLAESGLVTVTRIGNQKHYQANRAAPVFEELRGIALKMFGPAEALRAALAPLAIRVRTAWLYGSVAKGADRAQSDIDVLIVADDLTLEEVYAALGPAEKRLGRTVSPTLYTLKEFERRRAAKNPFLSKVLAGERILLMGEDHAAGATR